jgi:hypothetical protein
LTVKQHGGTAAIWAHFLLTSSMSALIFKPKTKDHYMRIAVIAILFVFWMAMAFIQFQRGDMVLAGLFVLVGIALTIYRLRK